MRDEHDFVQTIPPTEVQTSVHLEKVRKGDLGNGHLARGLRSESLYSSHCEADLQEI